MRVEYINPFVTSLKNAFKTMLACEARRGEIALKENNCAKHYVSGVIGLSGRTVGTVVLSFSEAVALKAASTMLMTETTAINEDVLDAVGELTNMVAGAAKSELEEFELQVSLPNVVTGHNHEIHFPSNVVPISISFETDWGPLTLEVGFAPVPEPVCA
ncbi:MAG: chemotaxis protein CheX [Pirellulales bacterium]|nr:chemotaxis protein CheX [Pirellulales bacterium]